MLRKASIIEYLIVGCDVNVEFLLNVGVDCQVSVIDSANVDLGLKTKSKNPTE